MSDLRELVEQWRKRAESNRNVKQRHDANQIARCADELEQALDENEERRPNATIHEPYGVRD